MNKIYIPDHFIIQEFVPPVVFEQRGNKAWELIDSRLAITADQLRKKFGPMTVNNWHLGGNRLWSGLRTEDSPYGSRYSQHRFGRAMDSLFSSSNVDDVRAYILDNPDEFPLIGSIEINTSWLHFDVRNCDRIKTYEA